MFMIGDDIGQAIGWLLGTLLCFIGIRGLWQRIPDQAPDRSLASKAQRWVPIFLAAGIFCQFIGQVIYTYYDIHHWAPFPSWADVGYLSTFPFLMVGILLLPTRRLSGMARSRVMLDSIMMMTAVVTFSWYFVLGPTLLQGYESNFALVVGSAYPFFDLILIFCVLRLSFHSTNPALTLVVRLLSLGLIIIVITDSIYDYQTLQNIYVNGWQDVGWPVGYMLIGLAAQAFNHFRSRQDTSPRTVQEERASREAAALNVSRLACTAALHVHSGGHSAYFVCLAHRSKQCLRARGVLGRRRTHCNCVVTTVIRYSRNDFLQQGTA